jgi:pimeloyl-ACP methyl ester carboxylesterase
MSAPRAAALLSLLAIAACTRPASSPAPFVDPAAHRVLRIMVAPGVRDEVLDWGGSGPALVFIAGAINTGHVFDSFAPRFTDRFRVIALTRRGVGASDVPNPGPYDAPTLAADVKAVLDSLGIARAVLVAHSFGATEAVWAAATYPDRVEKLVLLESSCAACSDEPVPTARPLRPRRPPITDRDTLTPEGMAAYQHRTLGFAFPQAELRAISRYGPGRRVTNPVPTFVREALAEGSRRLGSARVSVPTLGIFAERATVEQEFWWASQMHRPERILAQVYVDAMLEARRAARDRFARALPQAQVAVVPGAQHFVFLSHPDQTERLIRAFVQPQLPAAQR